MNVKFLAALAGAALLLTGCVDTVSGRKTAGVPWFKDTVEGRYERPINQVFDAARYVLNNSGMLVNEQTLHNETNMVKTLQAKLESRTVWVRVSPVDEAVTSILVQTRTKAGGVDMNLAHTIEKEIALRLATTPAGAPAK